jgi:hypothetical protein
VGSYFAQPVLRPTVRTNFVLFLSIFLIFSFLPQGKARVSEGVVVYPPRLGCSYFIVYAPMGYALLQLWSFTAYEPQEGDLIVGEFESYGFKEVINLTRKISYRVWVDDYFLSSTRVVEKYLRRCPAR